MNRLFIFYVSVILLVQITGCASMSKDKTNSGIKGIVKLTGREDRLSYTHKFQKNSIKALPILISTGYTKKDNKRFTEIQFRAYNKKTPLNYDLIEMYNSRGDKWQWIVNKRNKKYIEKRGFTIETYYARVDSKIGELIKFFEQEPIYLKLKGNLNNFKPLESSHIESILTVLEYARSLQ